MSAVLTELDDLHLIRAIKNNHYDFFRLFQKSPAVKTYTHNGLFRWRTAVSHPWFNGVLCSSPPDHSAGQLIQDTLVYFRTHNIPAFTWWLEPGIDAHSWEALMLASGFQFVASPPGMAAILANLPQQVSHPADFTIQMVDNLQALDTWNEVFIRGYELPAEIKAPFYGLISSLGIELPVRYYLGLLDGQPVSTCTLFLSSGVAGIYNVATLPQARRMGLGTAITLQALLTAREMGYKAGILQSSEMGFSVYTQLGFRNLCTMDHYHWSA